MVQQIMLKAVICTRKAALDDLLEGLSILRFSETFLSFTEEFESLFVSAVAVEVGQLDAQSLVDMLEFEGSSAEDEITYQHLKTYIGLLDADGMGIVWSNWAHGVALTVYSLRFACADECCLLFFGLFVCLFVCLLACLPF